MADKEEHFRSYFGTLEKQLEKFWRTREGQDLLDVQREQVEGLVKLEHEFKLALIGHSAGIKVYRKFVDYICSIRCNILDARPYFRERQKVFTEEISTALRDRRARALYKFRFNWRFISFALKAHAWAPKSKVNLIAAQIAALRNDLVRTNLPLANQRARKFFKSTPQSHLEHMDLVQIAAEGLLSAVDKFVPPFKKAFRDVMIGRMVGNFIEQYSETLVHFYPNEKRKLYRAHKWVGKNAGTTDFKDMAAFVNAPVKRRGKAPRPVKGSHRTNEAEIHSLTAAASTVSADSLVDEEVSDHGPPTRSIERYAAPPECQPDVIVEREQAFAKLKEAGKLLTLRQKKLLMLRGISEDSL